MIFDIEKKDIQIGISACLIGQKVRFDSSNKPSRFCIDELSEHVEYEAFCPEVAIGLPIPRPTIRQIKKDDMIHIARPDGSGDVTEALQAYGKKVADMTKHLSGYIFCAKSPTCGMERVKVYSPEGNSLKSDGIGSFAKEIMEANPLLPCEENGRLNDMHIRENFVARIYAYKHWQQVYATGLTKHKLTTFHSHYKYTVMSHNLVAYRELGQLLANDELSLHEKSSQYISGLMEALKIPATRKNHVNTLTHIQGYFTEHLNALQRKELCEKIDGYRLGLLPLIAPLTLLNHYLLHYPKDYLKGQSYLSPYPDSLRLRYAY